MFSCKMCTCKIKSSNRSVKETKHGANEFSNEKQSDINVEEWLSTIKDMDTRA